jgi:membrane protein YdbS with pleckstrin-like domain
MKTFSTSTRVVIWILAGVVVIMTAIALTIPTFPYQNSATAGAMLGTVSSTPQPDSEVGSTDGIVMLAAIITLIITVPIILRWKDWARKDKKDRPTKS